MQRILRFYLDGFRGMVLGRTLWLVILLKLLVMFAVLKPLFFTNILKTRYETDAERADYIIDTLTRPPAGDLQ
jgi:hypothetical protein